jgi:Transcription factor WhiB
MPRISLPGPEIADRPTPVLSHRVGAAGLCSDSASDRWFPTEPKPTGKGREAYEQFARAVCLGCTVLMECRELALRIESQPNVMAHGIWGGLAPWERDNLRRRRREHGRRPAESAGAPAVAS